MQHFILRSYLLNRQQLVSCHNKLSEKRQLNIGVTQGSVLGTIIFLIYVNVCLGDDSLDQSNCIDYLGVKLDAHLTWNSQIDAVCKELVFAIFRLGRLRNVIAPNMMLHIYQCIIQPRLDYAITLWGFTSQLYLSRVQRLQNRAARIITGNFDYINVRGIDIVKRLQWMNVIERRDYFVALTVFKVFPTPCLPPKCKKCKKIVSCVCFLHFSICIIWSKHSYNLC